MKWCYTYIAPSSLSQKINIFQKQIVSSDQNHSNLPQFGTQLLPYL